MKGPRKLLEIIFYVAKKAFLFYVILMIYVIAVAFSTLALQEEDATNFRESFELNYRNTFTDFGAKEDQYTRASDLISFLISSYIGPLILLNLLISVMADLHGESMAAWPIEEVRGIYSLAQEILCILSTHQAAKCCKSDSIFGPLTEEKGYIHYCIPAPTYGVQDAWHGQANQIEGHLKRSEHRILSALQKSRNEGNDVGYSEYSSPVKGQNDAFGPQLNQRIEAVERNINARHEALERSISGRHEALDRNMRDLDAKMNKVLDLIQKSRS